jgi:hypothetical protein
MTNRSTLIERAQHASSTGSPIEFTDEELASMSEEDAAALIEQFGSTTLMLLPSHERAFHDWLREAEPPVWNDLWSEAPEQLYAVSLAFLSEFRGTGTEGAFPICDLQTVDNYFFTPDMLLDRESTDFVEAVRSRFLAGGSLSPEQALTVEISTGPMDIWHFAYRRGVDLARAKKAVASLVEDRIVVHVPKADHLSTFFGAEE